MQDRYHQPRAQWHAKRATDGDEIAVGHHDYVTVTDVGISYYDPTTIPKDAKTKKWCSLIAYKRKIIIRPSQENCMKSYDENHWGTIYDIICVTMTAHSIFMELSNPVKLKPIED